MVDILPSRTVYALATGGRYYVCGAEGCGRAFGKQSELVKHRREAHAAAHTTPSRGEFACQTCGRTFTRRSGLAQHVRIHDPESQQPLFTCEQCGCSYTKVCLDCLCAMHACMRVDRPRCDGVSAGLHAEEQSRHARQSGARRSARVRVHGAWLCENLWLQAPPPAPRPRQARAQQGEISRQSPLVRAPADGVIVGPMSPRRRRRTRGGPRRSDASTCRATSSVCRRRRSSTPLPTISRRRRSASLSSRRRNRRSPSAGPRVPPPWPLSRRPPLSWLASSALPPSPSCPRPLLPKANSAFTLSSSSLTHHHRPIQARAPREGPYWGRMGLNLFQIKRGTSIQSSVPLAL